MTAQPRVRSGSAPAPLRYALPATDGAVWLGLRAGALLAIGASVTVAVLVLLAGLPIPLAVLALSVGVVVAAVPVAGRSPLAWTPVLLHHLHQRATGRTGWSAHLHKPPAEEPVLPPDICASQPSLPAAPSSGSGRRLHVPTEYGRLHLLGIGSLGGVENSACVGVLQHRSSQSVTVVLDVTGADRFALLEPAAQDSQLARWGTCLSALAADPQLLRMQWLSHTRPDTRDYTQPAATEASPQGAYDADGRLRQDYLELVTAAGHAALSHQHLLALTLRADPALASGRRGGSGHRSPPARAAAQTAAGARLIEQVRDLAATLLCAELLPHPLSPTELGTTWRRLLDPALASDLHQNDVPAQPEDPGSWAIRSRRSQWDSCRTDDTWHRSFAVTGWPRLALPADWLAPILHTPPPAGTSRTLAVHAVPVPPQHAARQARSARAKARLDAADRGRLGFTQHPGDELAEADAAEVEGELVAGYRLSQLTALVSISAPDLERLRTASTALRTLSVSNRLDLRPLHGQHHRGLVGCLPLGVPLSGARP